MLGEWVNESDDGILVKTHCKWSDNGNFLLREFDVKVEGRMALSGALTHRPGTLSGSNSGCGSSMTGAASPRDCCRASTATRWITKASGVRSDGQSVSTTSAFTATGKEIGSLWETLERTIGGEVIALAPISTTSSDVLHCPASDPIKTDDSR